MAHHDKDYLKSLLDDIIQECSDNVRKYSNEELANYFVKLLNTTVSGGKCVRAFTAIHTYEILMGGPENVTTENKRLIGLLGMTIEMLQANFLILDDILDGSLTRRGQPCWYLNDGVGLIAINDAVMIEESMYFMLRTHFRHLDCYTQILDTFHDIVHKTSLGQMLDWTSSKKSVYEFNLSLYKNIVDLKTANYTTYLPVSLALSLAGHKSQAVFDEAKEIMMKLGFMFQVQDDYLDCYGDERETGKVGNDIQEGKCTWLAAKFMEIASDEQRVDFVKNYRKNDAGAVKRVKELYEEVGMSEIYSDLERESFEEIKKQVMQSKADVPEEMYFRAMDRIYGRRC